MHEYCCRLHVTKLDKCVHEHSVAGWGHDRLRLCLML